MGPNAPANPTQTSPNPTTEPVQFVTVEAFKSVEQTIIELANTLKGTLKTVSERMESVEKQLEDAQRINAESPQSTTFKPTVPVLGPESVGNDKIDDDYLFKGITESTTKAQARAILNKAVSNETQSERIKEFQEWADRIKILCGYTRLRPSELACFPEYENWLEKSGLGKVMSVADSPASWVPEGWSSEILNYYQQRLMIATLFESFEMPQDPFRWDFLGTGFTLYLRSEPTTDPASSYRASDPSQSVITFSTSELAGRLVLTRKLSEDALAGYIPKLRTNLIPRAMAEAMEKALLNGDDSATHFDTVVTAADDVRKAWIGLRKIANRESAQYDVQTGSLTYAYLSFSETLLQAGKYGIIPAEGAWVMSNTAYIKALAFDEVETADKINLPTNVNGVVNNILGRPVIVSPEYSLTLNSSTGIDDGTSSTTGFLHVNRDQFMIGFRREDEIEQDRDINTGQETMVITNRKDFQQMHPTGETTVGAGINVPT